MARLPFPESGSRRADDSAGNPVPNRTYTVYSNSGGTILATIAADSGGAPGAVIADSKVPTDSYGYLPIWWGPTDGTKRLWLSDGIVAPWPVDAIPGDRIDALDVRVTAVEISGGGGGGAVQSVAGRTGDIVLAAADVAGVETPAGAQAKADDAQAVALAALATHEGDTTSVHGIADTAALETTSGAQAKADAAQVAAIAAAATDATSKAEAAQAAAIAASEPAGTAAAMLGTHIIDTTAVHGIADTSLLETSAGAQAKVDALATQTIPLGQKGAALGVATLGPDGKLTAAQIPSISIVNFIGHVADEAAMLATNGQLADFVIRDDLSTGWVITGADPTQLSNWTELPYPTAPVTSVAGRTGSVVVTKSDVGLANAENTADADKPVSTAAQAALDLKAPIAGPTFTGTVGGVTKAMVGLGSVDNTSDANKPVSTDQQTALDAKATRSQNLADLTSASTARTNLGLGGAATLNVGTTAGTVAAGDDARVTGAAQKANNLSDLASTTTARTNLGAVSVARLLTAGTGLIGGGDLSADRTFVVSYGTSSGTAAQGNDTRITGAAQKASNLSDLASAATAKTNLGLGNVDNTADTAKPVSTAQQTALNLKADKANLWFNVKDYGAVGNGSTDDSAALNALFASLPATGGATVYFPVGIYQCSTVNVAGWILLLQGKQDIRFVGAGTGAHIRTTTATATELLRVETCNRFGMDNMRFSASGTAKVTHAVHYTTSSPGSAHHSLFQKVFINGPINFRRAWDGVTTAGSPTIYTAQTGQTDYQGGSPWQSAQFSAADVGGLVTIQLSGLDLFASTVTAVQQYTATLASDINSSTLTIPLVAPLSPTAPSGGFVVNIDGELFFVSSGGTTTTLTCTSRGRGLVYPAAVHTAGATVSFSSATLADNVPATVSNGVAPLRIQPGSVGWLLNGFSVGADHPGAADLDIAQLSWLQCDVTAVAKSAWHLGNGTTANVLNLHMYGCSADQCGSTVTMNGANAGWHGGGTGTNLIFFKRIKPGIQEIVIDGVRCDGAALFWESAYGGTIGPATRIASVECKAFNATDWTAIRHTDSMPLTLENVSIHGATGFPVNIVAIGTTPSPLYLTAINVVTSGSANPFTQSGTAVVRTIIPGPRVPMPTLVVGPDTVGGVLFDNRLQLRGGLTRKRTTVADANYTILLTDMTVAYTSITAARVATLPSVSSASSQEFTVKDESGSCSVSNTITVTPASGTIDGAANLVLNAAYAKTTVYSNGTNWFTR
jgi:hypothetical protein